MNDMNEITHLNAGMRHDPRIVAHLEYPLPHIKGDTRFNSIITACIDGRWICGYDVTTNTFGHGVGVCAHFLKTFGSEHAAVYDTIRRIRELVAGEKNDDDRNFALRLCDLAYDNVNPKLF